jgi:hypothetical protein
MDTRGVQLAAGIVETASMLDDRSETRRANRHTNGAPAKRTTERIADHDRYNGTCHRMQSIVQALRRLVGVDRQQAERVVERGAHVGRALARARHAHAHVALREQLP